ncbi:MAG: TonB-dependent receptor [Gammaproteobacteria bacterium]|nr:TonB-dependent receptor [Gammaproteobacteria bacterium]
MAATPVTSAAGAAQRTVDEIIVTARRRTESLQAVPIAVTVLSGAELRQRQVYTADQLAPLVPNLEFDIAAPASGATAIGQIFIRGIGQTDFTPVTDPGVALYVDGVYLARSPGNVLDLVDIERVEVLRGPQGTLFGRNSIGGAIKVHSVRPDPDGPTRSAELRLGTDRLAAVTLKANQPLAPGVAGSLAVNVISRDGYVQRPDGVDTGDRSRWSARGALTWELGERVSAYVVADFARIDENGAPTVSGGVNDRQPFATFGNALLPDCSAVAINPGFDGTPASGPPSFPPPGAPTGSAPGCFGPASVPGPFVSEGTFPLGTRLDSSGLAVELDWTLSDAWSLVSTTGWRTMTMISSRDGDNTPANIFATRDDYDHRQLSEELQLRYTSPNNGLRSVLGLYLFDEQGFNLVDVTLPTGALRSGGFYDTQSYAVFAHNSIDLTERLEFSFGARHTRDRKAYLPDQFARGDASMGSAPGFFGPTWPLLAGSYLAPSGPLPAGTRILDFRESQVTFDSTDWSANLSYQLNAALMGYLSYATAYKSGGFDQRFVGPTPDGLPSSYEPESVRSVEIGAKGDWFAGRLRASAALFNADYDDLQIIVRESFNPLTRNAGKARVRGGELEVDWVPTDAWSLRAGIGYLDSGYRSLSAAAQASGVQLDNVLVNAPEWSASVSGAYRAEVQRVGTLTTRVDWSWHGEQFNDAINSPQIRQASYQLLNASLALDTRDERWQFMLAARNLLDETILITGNSAFDTAAAYVEQVFARPREVQFTLRRSF